MSHDADKLIRQLSLVAFLMAERRLLTARDVKSNVEGYSEMSDEAFARRFYSDRAELTALGVPLQSQRDEFTGEELYTLRSENYFLDRLELDDDELAALQTALYYLEGKFAYAEPLRLALQNLALGRVGLPGAADRHGRARSRQRARLLARARRPAREARVRDLEAAHRSLRLLEPAPRAAGRAHGQPVRAPARRRQLVRRRPRPRPRHDAHVQGLAHPRRHPLRDASRARLPDPCGLRRRAAPRPAAVADRRDRRHARVSPSPSDTAWWVERTLSDAGHRRGRRLRDRLRERRAPRRLGPPPERPRGPARARRARRVGRATALARARASARRRGARASPGRSGPTRGSRCPSVRSARSRRSDSACCRRSSRTSSPPAATSARRRSRREELAARFSIPLEELQDHLSLLNLVNFGGGCYAVYAEHDGDVVRVEKELYGDVFRRPPKLTPLEARAIRLAIEYVGPTIAADAHTPLKRVRKKLEETFGRFDLAGTPAAERRLGRGVARQGAERRRREAHRRRDRVPEGRRRHAPSLRQVEPYTIERELPVWRVHTWDLSVDARADVPPRPDALRAAHGRRASTRVTASIRRTSTTRASPGSSTRPRSHAGSSSVAHAR